jgi:hypothetical protein
MASLPPLGSSRSGATVPNRSAAGNFHPCVSGPGSWQLAVGSWQFWAPWVLGSCGRACDVDSRRGVGGAHERVARRGEVVVPASPSVTANRSP